MAFFQPGDGVPEKIGTILGAALTIVVFVLFAWLMAHASGLL